MRSNAEKRLTHLLGMYSCLILGSIYTKSFLQIIFFGSALISMIQYFRLTDKS